MMIYTSYYAKANRLNTDEYLLICVSSSSPSWFKKPMVSLEQVFPSWDLINGYKNGSLTEEQYTAAYMEILTSELRDEVLTRIQHMLDVSDKRMAVLLCWCKGFCHRHILNKWLNGNGELD